MSCLGEREATGAAMAEVEEGAAAVEEGAAAVKVANWVRCQL